MQSVFITGSLLMTKVRHFHPEGVPKKKGIMMCGKQPESTIWAVNPNLFIDEATGNKIQ